MASLQLDIVTPDKKVLHTDAEYVGIPGIEGEFGILPGHIPFLSALNIGALHYTANGKTLYAFIAGGFAEISDNTVTILADVAELADQIDPERAQKAKERAEKRLAEVTQEINVERANLALRRAVARLSIVPFR